MSSGDRADTLNHRPDIRDEIRLAVPKATPELSLNIALSQM
jgi:hypothetical protein